MTRFGKGIMFYLVAVQGTKDTKGRGESKIRKNANVLRIPRRTVEAPQVPQELGVEKSLDQKRAEQMTLMSPELLTLV
jgi:hypothetical protein